MQPSQPYISKSERVNPNVRAAGGDLVHGDKAPRGGDPPGERVRTNPSSAGAASQAPGASAIADKAHALAEKAAAKGDQGLSLRLLQLEKTIRAKNDPSRAHKLYRKAHQTAGFFKRQGITAAGEALLVQLARQV